VCEMDEIALNRILECFEKREWKEMKEVLRKEMKTRNGVDIGYVQEMVGTCETEYIFEQYIIHQSSFSIAFSFLADEVYIGVKEREKKEVVKDVLRYAILFHILYTK